MNYPDRAIAQIDRLKETAADTDWDSHDAFPVGLEQREQAKRCVVAVVRATGGAFADPIVSPIADPGLVLIWKKKGHAEVDALFTSRGATYVVLGSDRKFVKKGAISSYESFAKDVLEFYLR